MSGLPDFLRALMAMGTRCVYCGREIPDGDEVCAACAAREAALRPEDPGNGVWHVYRYEGVARRLILNLKYNDMPHLAGYAAGRMHGLCEEHRVGADIVSFVPVHESRLRSRGFDQSELLAGHLSVLLGLPFARLVERVKKTKPQFELDAAERERNVRDAFARYGGMRITGKRVLLVDDIYTTGATMRACASRVGGARVIPLVLCREY